jgi:putative membrane protein
MEQVSAARAVGKWPPSIWIGLAVLAATWLGPLPSLARTAFSPAMIMHLAVVSVASPFLAAGLGQIGAGRFLQKPVQWIVLATLFDMLIVLGWHVPVFHEAAARSWPAFALEQVSFLAAGLGIWCLAFVEPTRKTAIAASGAFFMTFAHMTVLGCILILAPHLLYDPDVCQGAFGLSPLADQRLGGLLMASWGSFAYLGGGAWLLWRGIEHLH